MCVCACFLCMCLDVIGFVASCIGRLCALLRLLCVCVCWCVCFSCFWHVVFLWLGFVGVVCVCFFHCCSVALCVVSFCARSCAAVPVFGFACLLALFDLVVLSMLLKLLVLCYYVLRCAMDCVALSGVDLCGAVPCRAVPCPAVPCRAAWCCVVLFVLCCLVLFCLFCFVSCCIVLRGVVLQACLCCLDLFHVSSLVWFA